jgi:hypothetical protein
MSQSLQIIRPKLFLSHGATKADFQTVDNIVSGLEENGFDVFEYRGIESGQQWRYCLLAALLLCDFAVVLEDKRAKTRKWVRYEIAVLKAKRELEPNFVIQTVTFEPSTDTASLVEELSKVHTRNKKNRTQDPWIKLPTTAIVEGNNYSAALTKIIEEQSAVLNDVDCKNCIEALVIERRIGRYLRDMSSAFGKELLADLQRVPVWDGSDIPWSALDALERVAKSSKSEDAPDMAYDIGRACVQRGLYVVPTLAPSLMEEEVRKIINWLTPLMLPLSKVRQLADLFTRDSSHEGPYVVSAKSVDLVFAAIQRAWGAERGPYRAPIVEVPGWLDRGSGDLESQLERAISDGLARFARSDRLAPALAEKRLAKIVPRVRTEDQNAALAFVVVRDPIYTQEVIEHVRMRLRELVFIIVMERETSEVCFPTAISLGELDAGDLGFLIWKTESLLCGYYNRA